MGHSLIQETFHMAVIQTVVDDATSTTRPHHTGGPENPKLMGDCGNRHAQQGGEIADAHLLLTERVEDADPSRISEDAEEIGNIRKEFFSRHPGLHAMDDIRMNTADAAHIHVRISPGNLSGFR